MPKTFLDLVDKFELDKIPAAESDGLRTGFRRKPDSIPMIADSPVMTG
jgi:hypothetical protein